jgi:hypothetical protein
MTTAAAPSGRRERKKAQTRRLVSDTATRMFTERGLADVTVKQVADAVPGLSAAGRRYPGATGLRTQLLRRGWAAR